MPRLNLEKGCCFGIFFIIIGFFTWLGSKYLFNLYFISYVSLAYYLKQSCKALIFKTCQIKILFTAYL